MGPMSQQKRHDQGRTRAAAPRPAAAGAESRFRHAAKTVYYGLRFVCGRIARLAGSKPPRVTVVLYHRVNDELRDSVTVGVAQFDRQMALLRRHCQIVSIEDVVAGNLPRASRRPVVCVTFDDGYKDNFTNARPILLKHRVPASFFVATGLIGTAREFAHDRQKGIFGLENMNWDDLRRMRAEGFVIGSHTVNHIDCAKEPGDTVSLELADSMAALKRELGCERVIFAYPFGGRHNMTPEALARVKQAGYVGCLSAYGGTNRDGVDPFDVRRGGINWSICDMAFLCRAYGFV